MALWRRAAPKAAIIDKLDSLALAAVVLETAGGLRPLGTGAICYRESDDLGFQPAERAARTLLEHHDAGPVSTQTHSDGFGFKWLIARREPDVYPSLVSDLHAASKAFADSGFGAQLLCAVTFFEREETTPVALVYLYKRGTFYPFAPQAEHTRNNRLELAIKNALDGRVPIEPDLKQWFPVWDVPGLQLQPRPKSLQATRSTSHATVAGAWSWQPRRPTAVGVPSGTRKRMDNALRPARPVRLPREWPTTRKLAKQWPIHRRVAMYLRSL